MNSQFSAYVHIPFCASKCGYCNFASYAGREDAIDEYFSALKKEICGTAERDKKKINTVYIGGGTPSFVDAENIADVVLALRDNFDVDSDCEISIECNPGMLTQEKLAVYKDCGVNRISLGMQSSSNKLLKVLGRIHTYEQALECAEWISKTGFDNFNIDLMFALPNQSLSDWEKTVKDALNMNPSHISAYSLTIEKGTPFDALYGSGELIDDALDRAMYHYLTAYLKENKFDRYEISNFALNGRECRHNLYCWHMEEYLGFGAAAHSFVNGARKANVASIGEYVNLIEQNKNAAEMSLTLGPEEIKSDYRMLALRTSAGIDLKDYENNFCEKLLKTHAKTIEELSAQALIIINDERIFLTDKGFDFANIVMREFI